MMSKRRGRHFSSAQHPAPAPAETYQPRGEVFSFGDPEAVLDARDILDYLEVPLAFGGNWYEPPISMTGLAKSARSAVHHASAMQVKRNIMVSTFKPHKLLTRTAFARLVDEFQIFGNCYFERIYSRSRKVMKLDPLLARYTRRGADLESFWWVPGYKMEQELPRGEVFHLMMPDWNQEVYGVPEYIPALHSAWLNESATLFRRKYYKNGSHAGFILYLTDAQADDSYVEGLRKALKDSKGPGNFRNLFMYAPNGKKDGLQLIPVSEVAAKDEFAAIKNVTRDDQLAAHRVPPQLMGIVPTNNATFGDPATAAVVMNANEIIPWQARFLEINDWMGEEIVSFDPYSLALPAPADRPLK